MTADAEPVITKRRVTMRAFTAQNDGTIAVQEAVDYVRPDFLDAYVAEATGRWQVVEVSEEPDAGPAGYHGATYVPKNLPVENAGRFYPATPGSEIEAKLKASESAAEGN